MAICNICHKTFSRPDVLLRHIKTVHNNDKLLTGYGEIIPLEKNREKNLDQYFAQANERYQKKYLTPYNNEDNVQQDSQSDDVRFKAPFTCIVSAPTKSGKTELVKKIVKYKQTMITPISTMIVWCYGEWQPAYESLRHMVHFCAGLPNIEDLKTPGSKLLIMDDLMTEAKKDQRLTEIFCRGCHHWNVSIIHIVQNIFYEGLRTSRINAQYLILMKNPSDRLQVQTLGRQLYPGSKHFMEAYEDATTKPFGDLLIDLTQTTMDMLRLRTDIFPDDGPCSVYMQKE